MTTRRIVKAGHPALGVMDDHDLAGPHGSLAQRQGPQHVVGHHAASVTDQVRITDLEPERAEQVEAAVHAGHHGQAQLRPQRAGAGKLRDVGRVGVYEVVDRRHAESQSEPGPPRAARSCGIGHVRRERSTGPRTFF